MMLARLVIAGLLTTSSISATTAFAPHFSSSSAPAFVSSPHQTWRSLRGGEQEDPASQVEEEIIKPAIPTVTAAVVSPKFAMLTTSLTSFGKIYSQQLEARPIATKSVTAGLIFALSDYLAQRLERTEKKESLNWTRLIASTLIGLLYFGPAAHYWYEGIFKLLPGTSLASSLAKAFWGQVIFGPSFTCIFFATSLLQSGTFSLGNWWDKIRKDLPGAWIAGAGFWPLVDLISYSIVPMKWIPLFVNMCSLVWTIYLSGVSNRSAVASKSS
jgi:protein Mpv17